MRRFLSPGLVLGAVLSAVAAHADDAPAEAATTPPPLSNEPLEIIHVQLSDPPQPSPSPRAIQPLEEIVVTAQKREERLIDVPVSVQAFSGARLEALGVSDERALQRVTPGLESDEQAGFSTIYLRGIGSDAFLMADPSVASYTDGVYLPFSQGLIQDFGAIDRVEVLKGPQGTLFGRNAVGGAINVITRVPRFGGFNASIETGYDNRDTVATRVYANVPITSSLAFNVSGLYSNGDYYMKGSAAGAPLGREIARGGRVKLRWRPIEDLDFTLAALRAEHRGSGSAFQLNSSPSLIGSLAGIQPQTGYTGSVDEAAFSKFNTTLYYGTGQYSAPWFDVKLSGSRQTANAAFNYDFDGSPQPLAAFDQKLNEATITTAEAQILSNDTSWGAGWLNWIGGAYYFKSRQGFNPATLKLFGLDLADQNPGGISLPQPILNVLSGVLNPLGLQFPNGDVAFHALIGTESIAGYVQTTVKPTSWLGLTFGGRYQSERRYIIRSDSGLNLADGGFSPLFTWTQARDANGNPYPTTSTTNSFKPKATIDIHPFGDDTLFYASYQEALKSGTYNTVAIYEPPAYVKPEEIRAYEVGAKTRLLDGLVTLSAAGFQYDIRNFQVQFISLIQGGAVSFENAQAARIRGGDLDGSVVLLPHWVDGLVLNGGLAYLDAHYTDYTGGSGFDPQTGVFSTDNNFSGKRIVRTPKFTATAALTKTWRLPGGPLETGADFYYNSGYYYAASNAENTHQSAYPLLGARISYLYQRWKLRATLYGQNLNDRKYSQGEIGTDFGTNITLAPPRTFGGKLGLEF